MEWTAIQRRTLSFCSRPGMNILNVRYEDLLTDPERELTNILAHIDKRLEYSDALLQASSDTDAIPDAEKEWKEKASQKPDASRIYAWKSKPEAWHKYAALCNSELEAWGYEPQPTTEIGFIDRIKAKVLVSDLYRNFRAYVKIRSLYDN